MIAYYLIGVRDANTSANFQGSILAELFTEDDMRVILPDCKLISKDAGEIIFRYDLADRIHHWTYVIEGEVTVSRTIDDEEVSQCKSVENSFFGAYKHLRKALQSHSMIREEEEPEVPIIQGGNGVKNTIIKAATPVKMIRMLSKHLLKLLEVKGRQYQTLAQHLQLEDPSRDVNLPLYSLQAAWKHLNAETIRGPFKQFQDVEGEVERDDDDETRHVRAARFGGRETSRRSEDHGIVFFERSKDDSKIYGKVSELQRKRVKEAMSSIEKVWAVLSQGAPEIPVGTICTIQDYLGEGGEQLFADLIKPLSRPGGPASMYPEHFWFCFIDFLSETTMASALEDSMVLKIDTDQSDGNNAQVDEEGEDTHGQSDYLTQRTSHRQDKLKTEDAVQTDSNLWIFDEKESLKQKFESFMFKDRQIESRLVEVSPVLIETEFARVAGELSGCLMGDSIRQYLKYTIVHHPYPISLANCREFCTLFGKKFAPTTKILYPEIIKMLRDKKSQAHDEDELFIESALNPGSLQMRVWIFLMRLVALYHFFMVPIRISFLPYRHFTSWYAVASDVPMDVALGLHVLISLNTAFRDARSSWVTDRIKIFRDTDFICLVASLPIDWFAYLIGYTNEGCSWLRLNKMVLYFSRISPRQILYSKGESNTIRDLLVVMLLILHICAAVYFLLGRAAPSWRAEWGKPQISWFFVEDDHKDSSYPRSEDYHFVFSEHSWAWEKYLFSLYWVATTITVSGQVGTFLPQNTEEILFTICMMILNMTVYRYVIGEVSSIIMSADDSVVKAREDLERLTTFTSSRRFSNELREEIKSHFESVQSGSSGDQDKLLSGLSHGLRVELARFISRDFLTKIDLVQGCSHQMLDSICVLLIEVTFIPEEIVFRTGEIAKELYFVLQGALEELDSDQDKVVRTARRNSALGTIPFSFGLRHFATARASRSGCVCMRLTRENLFEVLKTHPEDEETVMQNSLRTLNNTSRDATRSLDSKADRNESGSCSTVMSKNRGSEKSCLSQDSEYSRGSRKSHHSKNSNCSHRRSWKSLSSNSIGDSHESGSSGHHTADTKSTHHSRRSGASRTKAVASTGHAVGSNNDSNVDSDDDKSDVRAPFVLLSPIDSDTSFAVHDVCGSAGCMSFIGVSRGRRG
jgi:CRP-like cAMP-binding protein